MTKPTRSETQPANALALLVALMFVLTSCTGPRPLKGGHALTTHSPTGALQQSLNQGDNPAQPSRQDQQTVKVRTYTLPPGTRIEEASVQSVDSGVPVTNVQSIILSASMPVTEREETQAKTELGAAQKDTARELGAKLANLRGITWVGVALFLVGLASLVWPPLKLIVGSVTSSAALMLGGLALLILPTLIVGNELLILAGVVLTAGAWFLAHRHGQLRGLLTSYSNTPDPDPNLGSAAPKPTALSTKN